MFLQILLSVEFLQDILKTYKSKTEKITKPVLSFLACLICIQLFACSKKNDLNNDKLNISNTDSMKLKIIVGGNLFTAMIFNNATTAAFKTKLPLTINMTDLNGNEKYSDLPYDLPKNASNPGTIQQGDLMLYGSNTLVLFYKTFSTTYKYSPIGRINDPLRLAEALGSDNVKVMFELE
jgi:hypothetical protein